MVTVETGAVVVESPDRRGTTEHRRIEVPVLDGFRGMATLGVVVYHCFLGAALPYLGGDTVTSLVAAGYLGVDFFFVISGFLLFLPTVLNDGRFGDRRQYARRRIARIVPAYYVFLALVIVLRPWLMPGEVPTPFGSGREFLGLLAHLTFLQTTLGWIVGPPGYGLLTVAWTLTIEVAFYLLLPFVAARYNRHPLIGLVIALAVSLAWRAFATNVEVTLGWLGAGEWRPRRVAVVELVMLTQLPNYLAHFAAGMTAAWAFVRFGAAAGPAVTRRWALGCQIVAGAVLLRWVIGEGSRSLLPLESRGFLDPWTRTTPIAFAFAVLLLATALGPWWAQAPFSNRLSRGLGQVSYGVYLSHLAVVGFALTTLAYKPDATVAAFARMATLVLPVALVLGWLSWRLVERPARQWARRGGSSRPAVGSGAG